MNDNRIPVLVITGFLGSGKTSFINHLITHSSGRHFQVLESETGEFNIDRHLLSKGEHSILEECSDNGEHTIKYLKELAEKPKSQQPHHVIIESNGIDSPLHLVRQIHNNEQLAGIYRIQQVICVIDAANYENDKVKIAYRNQLQIANTMVLNKTDLITPFEQKKIYRTLRENYSLPTIHLTNHSQLPISKINALLNDYNQVEVPSTVTQEGRADEVQSVSFEIPEKINVGRVMNWIKMVALLRQSDLYRVKGIFNNTNKKKSLLLQGVRDQTELSVIESDQQEPSKSNQLLIIGKNITRKKLSQQLKSCIDN